MERQFDVLFNLFQLSFPFFALCCLRARIGSCMFVLFPSFKSNVNVNFVAKKIRLLAKVQNYYMICSKC